MSEQIEGMGKRLFDERIDFGNGSIMEFLVSKTRAFKEFQDIIAFVTSIMEASNYPFFVVDPDLRIQFMNPACMEFTGMEIKDISSQVLCKDVFQSKICESECAIRQAMNSKRPIVGKYVTVKDKKGGEHTIVVNAGVLMNKEGDVIGGFEVWRDAMPDNWKLANITEIVTTLSSFCSDMQNMIHALQEQIKLSTPTVQELLENMEGRTSSLVNRCKRVLESHCWDIISCPPERQVQCPAFPNNGRNCWEIDHTLCNGRMQGDATEKAETCSSCVAFVKIKKDTSEDASS